VRRALALLAVVALAGCGDGTPRRAAPRPPKLPRALAQSWQQQAGAVASALAAGDGCGAQRLATSLQASVVAAVNGRKVPRRFLEPLTSGVNALVSEITCAPPPAEPPKHGHKEKHDKGHGDE